MKIYEEDKVRSSARGKQQRSFSGENLSGNIQDIIGQLKLQLKYIDGKGLFITTKFNNQIYYSKMTIDIDQA